jgi:PST family polysaccharide transporter
MSDIKTQAVRSVAVTLGAQAAKFTIGLGVTMVLARLLTPKDYGVVAMVGVITGFVGVFRDGGLSTATVQRADITEAQISTLFWMNVTLGTGTALLLALLNKGSGV